MPEVTKEAGRRAWTPSMNRGDSKGIHLWSSPSMVKEMLEWHKDKQQETYRSLYCFWSKITSERTQSMVLGIVCP